MSEMLNSATNDELKFNPALAMDAMRSCNFLIANLLAIRDQVDRTKENTKDFAGPRDTFASGFKWAEGFRQLGDEARGILDSNVRTIQAMADLYQAAAKTVQNSEDESTREFMRVKMTTEANPDVVMYPSAYSVIDQKFKPQPPIDPNTFSYMKPRPGEKPRNGMEGYTLPNDDRALAPENSASLTWGQLYSLKENIATNVTFLAAEWGWMKEQLNIALDIFDRDVTNKPEMLNGWTGASSAEARNAAGKYVGEARKFANKMGDIEGRLYAAASWLQATVKVMPQTPQPPAFQGNDDIGYTVVDNGYFGGGDTSDECLESLMVNYRLAFDMTYIHGLLDYNSTLVNFDEFPTSGLPTLTPQPNTQDQNPVGQTGLQNGGQPSTPSVPSTPNPTEVQPTNPGTPNPTPKDETPKTDDSLKDVASLASTLLSSGSEALTSVVEQGVTGLQSLISSGTTALQQLMQQTTDNPTDSPTDTPIVPTGLTDPSKVTGTGGGGGGVPTGGGTTPKLTANPQSTLFPRATVSSETSTTSRAGLASTATGTTTSSTPMSGAPMSGAGAGAGQGKDYKRPDYLKSAANLDEVVEAPAAVLPVAEK